MNLNYAYRLAKSKLKEHNLNDWSIKFDRAKTRFGKCNRRTKTISLSSYLVNMNNEELVLDTILHEIAHALVGGHNGHNYIWRRRALSIGCNGLRVCTDEVKSPEGKFKLVCSNCNKVVRRHKRPRVLNACKSCCIKFNGGRFSDKYLFKLEGEK